MDSDGDGAISRRDFELLAEGLMENQVLDLERGTRLRSLLCQVLQTSLVSTSLMCLTLGLYLSDDIWLFNTKLLFNLLFNVIIFI